MKKTWNSLRLKYSDPVEILRTLDVEDGIRILVIGNGSMGAYEWVIEKGLHVDQHSDVGYGCADIALRDGLIAYYGPPRSSESETSTSDDWRPMVSAPLDGTEIQLLIRHHDYWTALKLDGKDIADETWQGPVTGRWIDHNGGGWTWHGGAGSPVGWRPLSALNPKAAWPFPEKKHG